MHSPCRIVRKLGRRLGIFITFCFLLGLDQSSYSEPWVSIRYAQNCAACHSPSRKNREFIDRRCTLSCQGCHVNPAGGGIRNFYGKWNQERWLRSFVADGWGLEKPTPAPPSKQHYIRSPGRIKAKHTKLGVPLVTSKEVHPDEDAYKDLEQHKIIAKSEVEFMSHVTRDDPLREERRYPVQGSGELRYMLINDSDRGFLTWPMAVDLGIRARPIRKNFSLVGEARFLNGPTSPGIENAFTREARVRSGYLFVDELPLNSYVIYGIHRPMFGNYNPDHTMLTMVQSGLGQRATFKGLTIGMAPNIPFFTFSLLQPFESSSFSQSGGFAFTVGGRWVTLGLMSQFSFWNTNTEVGDLNRQMWSAVLGGKIWRVILQFELQGISNEFQDGLFDKGSVWSVESKWRIWREFYLVANYASSNIARSTLKAGSASDLTLGLKSFLFAGTEIETLFVSRGDTDDTTATSTTANNFQVQIHMFF